MTLEKFRRTKKISYIELAAILGVKGVTPESTVFRWCNKERIPRKICIKIIKEKTKGKVKPSSFYEI